MKKLLLLALGALCGMSYASAQVVPRSTSEQDKYYEYQMTEAGTQQIMYQHTYNGQTLRFYKFQPEFLVPANVIAEVDGGLPTRAKVIDIWLRGWNNPDDPSSTGTSQLCTMWIADTNATALSDLDYDDFAYNIGDGMIKFSSDQVVCPLPEVDAASEENPAIIIETPLGSGINPFEYKGNNLLVKMWIENYTSANIDYFYKTYTYGDPDAGDVASTYRANLNGTVGFNFNANTKTLTKMALGDSLMYDIDYNTIPAFGLKYYTNDIFIENHSTYGYELYDANGNLLTPVDGAYYNLDYTATYTLKCGWDVKADKPVEKKITFGSIWDDVYVTIGATTAVEEVNAARTVASTRYFNVAGQEMAQPTGMTIVVTTYTDGTTSASKVIK